MYFENYAKLLKDVEQIQQDSINANDRLIRIKNTISDMETELRKKLEVGSKVPCKVAYLDNGTYVVHIWVNVKFNQFHVVKLSELD